MSIVDYACLLQDERPELPWKEALQRATLSLTGRLKIPPGLPGTRELAEKLRKRGAWTNRHGTTKMPDRPAPEHIRRNIARVDAAQAERQRTGGVLPTATFVQGGTMSKK